jgi:hypothetical protein
VSIIGALADTNLRRLFDDDKSETKDKCKEKKEAGCKENNQ